MNTYTELMMKVINSEPLSAVDKEQLRVMFQEMDNNRQVVSKWIGTDGKPNLDSPTITNPNFRSSPLHTFHAYFTGAPTEIANNTLTKVTFNDWKGDNSVFNFFEGDMSKIVMSKTDLNVFITGVVDWEANANGYRSIFISVHDDAGNQVGVKEISIVEAIEQAGIPNRVNFSYVEDIRSIFPNAAYFSMYVKQESGGGLDLESFVLSVGIA